MKSLRAARILAAIAVGVTSLTAIQAVTSPAEAICAGAGLPETSLLVARMSDGKYHTLLAETPVDGTCNNNGTYQTTVSGREGFAPILMRENGGIWRQVLPSRANKYVFPNDAYTASWQTSTRKSHVSLCVKARQPSGLWDVVCGYGGDYIVRHDVSRTAVESTLKNLAARSNMLYFGF